MHRCRPSRKNSRLRVSTSKRRRAVFVSAPQTRTASREIDLNYDRTTSGPFLYNFFRDYDPQTGRYVQADPIGLEGGVNPYVYVDADPIGLIDPEGLMGRGAGRGPYKDGEGPGNFPPNTITITVSYGLPQAPIRPPVTKTYSTACIARLGFGVKGSIMAAGAAAGKYGPPLLQNLGWARTASAASRVAAFSSSPVGWSLGGIGLIDYVDEKCQCQASP